MWIVKILMVAALVLIFIQDVKERMVYWFLYPLVGIFAFLVQWYSNGLYVSLANTAVNLLIVGMLLGISWGYCRMMLKKRFIGEAMGMGDVLLLLFLCCSFSGATFLILLIFSLVFSLMVHLYARHHSKEPTVPLAGYIAAFFAAVYGVSFFVEPAYLFAY